MGYRHLSLSTETIRFIRDGEKGGGGVRRKNIYLSLHCYHQNDSCIKMDSDESHFNVSLIVRDKVTRQCPQTTTSEEKREPKRIRIRTEVLLLTSLMPYRSAKPAHSLSSHWHRLYTPVSVARAKLNSLCIICIIIPPGSICPIVLKNVTVDLVL